MIQTVEQGRNPIDYLPIPEAVRTLGKTIDVHVTSIGSNITEMSEAAEKVGERIDAVVSGAAGIAAAAQNELEELKQRIDRLDKKLDLIVELLRKPVEVDYEASIAFVDHISKRSTNRSEETITVLIGQ